MVVCKCRKATKLYCFVHKVPVCGECICFPEHQICVVRTYSDWVIDGEYDWPPTCCLCHAALEDGNDPQTTRLGCLHIIHTNCLVSHIKSFPSHTAPAGYVCPLCSTSIWPPKSIKDSGSCLHSKLKEAIMQTGLEKNLFGNHPVSLATAGSRLPPPAFASDPLTHTGGREKNSSSSLDSIKDPALTSPVTEKTNLVEGYPSTTGIDSSKLSSTDIVEIDGSSSVGNQFASDLESNFIKSASPVGPGATTRKGAYHVDRQNSEISYYADDEDGTQKKYTRRGPFHHKFLRALLPFWSSALPTLPVSAPPRKDNTDDVPEGRLRHPRPSRMDPRKILLIMAIMACMATMGILYYRLAQRSLGDDLPDDEQQ
ncbi:PREDICTED: zinc finger protein-like 1 [Nelumbo nucifera]|uniref:Zinc finger protein-like 1 n=1 Tax=Nelumbo nucifera TaxID=4432 RepID=A0A1U8B7P7_NELNU|nr:PREDICTED: zinc finger protein-like 1 [Nelumbo nucifera]XP_010277063.1 PREDICTED: zinc finger protein-like 1 [Nelumbo nucifera]